MVEDLYNYIFWCNTHNGLWYAIERNSQLSFFNGKREDAVYFQAEEFETLIELLSKESLVKKYVTPVKEAKKKK